MSIKDFKSVEEQLEILRSRGLTINDDEKAKDFLLHNNYYRISGYSLTLRKNDVFSKSATFQNIVDIYNFDHELRHIILQHMETIEVQMKSVYTYEFTKVHGPIGYLDASFFTNESKHTEIINKGNLQKTQRLPHEAQYMNISHKPLWRNTVGGLKPGCNTLAFRMSATPWYHRQILYLHLSDSPV